MKRAIALVVLALILLTGCTAVRHQNDQISRTVEPTPARRPLTVAAVSCESRPRDAEFSLGRIEHWARRAAAEGADLALFPEFGIHGWWQDRQQRRYGEPVDGPSIQRLTRLAGELNLIMAVGMTERDGDKAYVTHVLLDGKGVIGKHRKSRLAGWPKGEGTVWDQGDDANVFDVKGYKVGIAICYESVEPETCAALRAKGAEIILAPYANGTLPAELTDPQRKQRKWLWQRPAENRVWYVGSDITSAFVFNPQGELVDFAPKDKPGEGMVVCRIPTGPTN